MATTSACLDRLEQPFLEAVEHNFQRDGAEFLIAQKAELPPGLAEPGDAEIRNQQYQVGAGDQRERPVGPVRRQVDENGLEIPLRLVDDREDLIIGDAFERQHFFGRGDDGQPAGMPDGDRFQQRWIEPCAGGQRIAQRQLGRQTELKGGVAKLYVEVDQAGAAADALLLFGITAGELAEERGRAASATSLDDGHQARRAGLRVDFDVLQLLAEGRDGGFDVLQRQGQGKHVMRPAAKECADKRKGRLIGCRDQRHAAGTRRQLLEALDRRRGVRIDLDHRNRRTRHVGDVDPFGYRDDAEGKRQVEHSRAKQIRDFALGPAEIQVDPRLRAAAPSRSLQSRSA